MCSISQRGSQNHISLSKWHCIHPVLWMWVNGTCGHFSGISVTGESCHMLSQWVIPELENVGLPNSVILQQYAAPAHLAADRCFFWITNFYCGLNNLDFLADLPEVQTWLNVTIYHNKIHTHSVGELAGNNEHACNTITLLYLEARHNSLLFCHMFGTSIRSYEPTR